MLVLCTLLPNLAMGNKKTGIFSKIASTKRDMQGVVSTGIEKGSSWAAASAAGRQGGMLEGFFDMFETMLDKQWGTPNSLLDQDLMGLMQDVFVRDPEHTRLLQEAWADPEIFRYLVDELPFFSVIKPLRALREKKVLSPQDVSRKKRQCTTSVPLPFDDRCCSFAYLHCHPLGLIRRTHACQFVASFRRGLLVV